MRMFPNLILLERPIRLLGKGVYLKGLIIFARQLKDKILNNHRSEGIVLTLHGIRANRFREIAKALESKRVSEIRFVVKDYSLFGDPKARVRVLNRAIRIVIRELATHGIRNKQAKCKITATSAESRNFVALITIDPSTEVLNRAEVKIEMGFKE
jgi:hypothetical protein